MTYPIQQKYYPESSTQQMVQSNNRPLTTAQSPFSNCGRPNIYKNKAALTPLSNLSDAALAISNSIAEKTSTIASNCLQVPDRNNLPSSSRCSQASLPKTIFLADISEKLARMEDQTISLFALIKSLDTDLESLYACIDIYCEFETQQFQDMSTDNSRKHYHKLNFLLSQMKLNSFKECHTLLSARYRNARKILLELKCEIFNLKRDPANILSLCQFKELNDLKRNLQNIDTYLLDLYCELKDIRSNDLISHLEEIFSILNRLNSLHFQPVRKYLLSDFYAQELSDHSHLPQMLPAKNNTPQHPRTNLGHSHSDVVPKIDLSRLDEEA